MDRNRGMLMSSWISIIISNNACINTVIKSAPNIDTIFWDVQLVIKVQIFIYKFIYKKISRRGNKRINKLSTMINYVVATIFVATIANLFHDDLKYVVSNISYFCININSDKIIEIDNFIWKFY